MVDEDRRALRAAEAPAPFFDDRIPSRIGAGGSPAQHDDPRDPNAGLRGRGAVGENRSGERCQPLPPRNHRKLSPRYSLTTRVDPLFAPSPQMPANHNLAAANSCLSSTQSMLPPPSGIFDRAFSRARRGAS